MLKNLNNFNKKPAKVMPKNLDRSGRYEDKSVILVQSIKNGMRLPKGLSQTNASIAAKESVAVYAHYFDGELTMDALATLSLPTANAIREAGQVLTGAEVIEGFASKRFHSLLTDEEKAVTIESIDPNEEYPLMTLIMKKDRPGVITLDEYKALSEEEQVDYNPRANNNNATLEGIVGPDGGFSACAGYAELGGSCEVYADEACTEITEVNTEVKQYTKQIVLGLSEAIDFGGQMANVAYLLETLGRTSKKGMVRGAKKEEVAVEVNTTVDATPENETVEAPINDAKQVEAPINDAKQVEAPINDAKQVEAPINDAKQVEAPINDAKQVEAPINDAKQVEASDDLV